MYFMLNIIFEQSYENSYRTKVPYCNLRVGLQPKAMNEAVRQKKLKKKK